MDNSNAGGKEHNNMKTYTMMTRALALTAVLSVSCMALAMKKTGPDMTLEQLTRNADEVVVGNVVKQQTEMIGNRFETNYTIQVHDTLKTRSGLSAGREFTMTLPGGAMTTPPLTQYVSGVPYMVEGEEVVLFLDQPAAPRATARAIDPRLVGNIPNSLRVVGWNQGRFSVITDPDTGEKLVTRINLEDFGLMNTSADTRRVLEALQKKQIPRIKRQLLRQQTSASAVRAKDPLELGPEDLKKLTVEERQLYADQVRRTREPGGIPVQSFETFKQQVMQFSNQ